MAIDTEKLDAFMGNFVHDLGAVMHAATVVVGDKLGLYKALAERPLTAAELAARTETDARYLREWLSAQAASGYVDYDPATDRFGLSEEQAFALTVELPEESPVYELCLRMREMTVVIARQTARRRGVLQEQLT